MNCLNKCLIALSTVICASSVLAQDISNVKQGDVFQVTLSDLKPTQPSVGYDQVYYKLGRYQHDIEKQFDEICEANGQKGLVSFDQNSLPANPTSFTCEQGIGEKRKDMKTIVLAPNNQFYLTDGHHTFNTFWHMSGGGSDFKVHVVVDKDYRDLANMDQFWTALESDKNAWLYDLNNKKISHEQLPQQMGIHNFANDPYRALMYYSRDVSWDKPKQPVPFLEFYWAKELKPVFDLNRFDLTTEKGYMQAVKEAADVILALDTDNLGGSGLTAKQMGQYAGFDEKEFNKMTRKTSKLNYMLGYKQSL
ncbi:chromosome partitioning protein ParB [Vibrio sp. UCD-FRSSP16_10]|uniref:ParB/Srx family N-terminal domain-containing protein n=1 Tax=unclassified Vibrio TaxID=2614977 RepID=UPI0007FBEEB5|nr:MULTISPECIES: ParB/Srx family N-terminal domain-containing protein [unclassified Vibrio]OBT13413.1 chromosome partitioning protein ParB [Vibrio sp. UCD-FRSSP16_10]OBT17923.1 chromosome partitioning protein ParB [Vibrio sp. UCD-FRSSP16_30]